MWMKRSFNIRLIRNVSLKQALREKMLRKRPLGNRIWFGLTTIVIIIIIFFQILQNSAHGVILRFPPFHLVFFVISHSKFFLLFFSKSHVLRCLLWRYQITSYVGIVSVAVSLHQEVINRRYLQFFWQSNIFPSELHYRDYSSVLLLLIHGTLQQ